MRRSAEIILYSLLIPILINAQSDWTNWGNNQHCAPRTIFYPQTLSEVQEIIRDAHDNKCTVKAVGSGHSWTDLVCTDGYLINTDALNMLLAYDANTRQVTVEAGIKLKDLVTLLADHKLCLSNQGFITEQSIAGAIATATHGTGHAYNLSDYIVGMQIIDAYGKFHSIDAQKNVEWLPLLRVHLGALGFIYAVTVQCEPLFKVKHTRTLMPVADVVNNYKQLYQQHDYWMYMFYPGSSNALLFTWDKTEEPVNVSRLHYYLNDCVFNRFLNQCAIRSFSYLHSMGPWCLDAGLHGLQMKEHVDYAYISLSPLKTPISVQWYIEQEIAVPFDDFPQALEKLEQIYHKYQTDGQSLISLITCRFGPPTHSSYLSPCYGRETAYITINVLNYFDEYEQFFQDFEDALKPLGGRPHWGKFHHLTYGDILQLYNKEHVCAFKKLQHLLDPDGIFVNDFIKRCFDL
jgi:FAD/FMN-containing dehydrogenase